VTTGPRHQAREAALQILYFWEVGGADPEDAIAAFFADHGAAASETVRAFAIELVRGTTSEVTRLDARIREHSEHWRIERLAVIDRLILRMAVWELLHQPDTPPAVVLNEALELARTFSTDDSVRFVNGVLDAIRKGMEAGR
jgi:transcription antitermination protein NusB